MTGNEVTAIMVQQVKDIDARDDAQIISELAGLPIDDLYYKVKGRRGEAYKLSWAGTKQAAQDRGNITLSDPEITETDDHWRVVFRATDLTRNISLFGGCHQPKLMRVNGKHEDDPFAFQKALSKSQRNAINALLPMTYLEARIKLYLTGNQKPRPAKSLPGPGPEVTPPAELEDITDFNELERVAWRLWKKQPAVICKELGYNSRTALINSGISPGEFYLQLEEIYKGN